MSSVKIVEKVYTPEDGSKPFTYERLAIIGSIDGVEHTLELKLEKSEMLLAKILLASNEDLSVGYGAKGVDIEVKRKSKNDKDIEDLLDL